MANRLVVFVLGNRNSGKSTTWYRLLGGVVRTGSRSRLITLRGRTLPVFVVSGSPEERKTYVGKIVGQGRPRLVLCSLQYKREAIETVDFFASRGYQMYVQWLNPGYADPAAAPDAFGLVPYLLHAGATVSVRDGATSPKQRVREIEDFIIGWTSGRHI
jgi:hypothetical protein